LADDQSVVLQANSDHEDLVDKSFRKAGERWLFRGPGEYRPSVHVDVLETKNDKALDSSEGVYIRNLSTGEIRAVIGKTVVLSADEEYWPKKLSPELSALIKRNHDSAEYMVVNYPVGENEAVQIFDYKTNTSRVVFGPELVQLQPFEEFKLLDLSGGVPKMEHQVKR